jgi:hypothetical protein
MTSIGKLQIPVGATLPQAAPSAGNGSSIITPILLHGLDSYSSNAAKCHGVLHLSQQV